MTFVVVYDACVLYPFNLRDLLIRIALTDLVQANGPTRSWMKPLTTSNKTDRTSLRRNWTAPGSS